MLCIRSPGMVTSIQCPTPISPSVTQDVAMSPSRALEHLWSVSKIELQTNRTEPVRSIVLTLDAIYSNKAM